MKSAPLQRGQIVERPDKWEQRGKYKRGKAVVMAASARAVTLCTFNPGRPIDHANPHVGIYTPAGLKVVGKAKTMPKACKAVLKWKKDFWRQHPFFKIPRALK